MSRVNLNNIKVEIESLHQFLNSKMVQIRSMKDVVLSNTPDRLRRSYDVLAGDIESLKSDITTMTTMAQQNIEGLVECISLLDQMQTEYDIFFAEINRIKVSTLQDTARRFVASNPPENMDWVARRVLKEDYTEPYIEPRKVAFNELQMGGHYIIEINTEGTGKRFYYGEIFMQSGPDSIDDIDGRMYFRNLVRIIQFPDIEIQQPLDRTDYIYIHIHSRPSNEYEIEYIAQWMNLYSVHFRDRRHDSPESAAVQGKGHKSKKTRKSKKMRKNTRK